MHFCSVFFWHSCCKIQVSYFSTWSQSLCVFLLTYSMWTLEWTWTHACTHIPALAYACPNICLRWNIVKFTWDECVFGPSRPGPIYWLNQGLFKKLIISGPHSHTLFYTLSKQLPKKQTNKWVCIYKFCKSLTPKPWWTGTKNFMSVFNAEMYNETYHQR